MRSWAEANFVRESVKTTATKKVEGVTKGSLMNRFLEALERAGNILPHPATLFVILAVLVIILSAVAAWMGVSVVHPGTKEVVRAESLLTIAGLHRILTSLVTNFTGFAPLGTVLVAMIFLAVGRHPLAGLAAAFAGVSGGFCANFLLGPTDPLLAGITQEAARIIRSDPANPYIVTPA